MTRKNPLLLILMLTLAACDYIDPLIQDANVVPVADEVQIGNQMQAEVAKSMVITQDARLTALGNRLVAALPARQFNYHFYIAKNPEPNAFTIPGATIYVHSGLLQFVDDENELAGVLAHEIGHAYERHPAKSITRQVGLSALISRVGGANSGLIKQMALKIAGTGALNFYSRRDESEADAIGFELLRRAGYRSDGLVRFLQKLLRATNGKQTPVFLSSHPPTPERIAALDALARRAA